MQTFLKIVVTPLKPYTVSLLTFYHTCNENLKPMCLSLYKYRYIFYSIYII
nr:MAG TPA: hypothetical protein [Caudoviricetes sp.]